MKCSIIGVLGTGLPCTNEATQLNILGHPVCEQCAKDSNYIASQLNLLSITLGKPAPYKLTNIQSNN